jgi:hypothetical protein
MWGRRVFDRPREIGREQARHHAGSWPDSGTLTDYLQATRLAVREAHRAHTLEYRWNVRFKLWDQQPETKALVDNTARIVARRDLAIEIAAHRECLLRLLTDLPRGVA